MGFLEKTRLEVVVFLCGVCGMVLELVGSRVIAPYFGSSLPVWTSLIGVILGSLSLGYFWGGKLADKRQSYSFLASILILAGIFIAFTAFAKEILLVSFSRWLSGQIEFGSILAVTILFAPASVILGIVSPYAAKLKLKEMKKSGSVVGNLYAISTFGSIVGTFMAGFYLVPFFGNTKILYMIAITLFSASIFLCIKKNLFRLTVGIFIFAFLFVLGEINGVFKPNFVADQDTQYGRIVVRDTKLNGEDVRYLSTDNSGWQSAVYLKDPDILVFNYMRAYRLANDIDPRPQKALMIGGAGYTFPRNFLASNVNASMDVVEIDPKMTEIARKYFFLKDDNRMNIIHQDARTFVKNSRDKYDVVFLDAFSGVTPPPHLTTQEFMSGLGDLLTDNGALFINLLSTVEGRGSGFYIAEVNTLRRVFPKLDAYFLQKRSKTVLQNILLVAYKNPKNTEENIKDPSLSKLLSMKVSVNNDLGNGEILTDDHAPVEYLVKD